MFLFAYYDLNNLFDYYDLNILEFNVRSVDNIVIVYFVLLVDEIGYFCFIILWDYDD